MEKVKLTKEQKIQDIKEKLLVGAFTLGVMYPLRWICYTYLTTHWIGSFGVLTAFMVTMIYLSKKNKLGKFGFIWKRQIKRFTKGKLGILLFTQSIIALLFFSSLLYFVQYGNNNLVSERDKILNLLHTNGLKDMQFTDVLKTDNLDRGMEMSSALLHSDIYEQLPKALAGAVQYYSIHPQIFIHDISLISSVENSIMSNNVESFLLILIVEELETFGFLIYFRFIFKPVVTT